MEQYLLETLLDWKVSYTTPYDFIQVILQDISANASEISAFKEVIASKAQQICELLLICIFNVVHDFN